MVGAILAGLSTAASLYGSLKSAQANKNANKQLQQRQSDLQSWYDTQYNTNYLDTAEAKSTLQVLRNNMKDSLQKTAQGNIIGGASDESKVATADKVQRRFGDTVTTLAGYGTQYKDAIRREYIGQKQNLDNLEAKTLENKSANWTNFANNAMSTGIGAIEAGGTGAFDKWDGKLTSLFKAKKLKSVGGMINKVPTNQIKMPTFLEN